MKKSVTSVMLTDTTAILTCPCGESVTLFRNDGDALFSFLADHHMHINDSVVNTSDLEE